MFNRSASLSVTILPVLRLAISSTGAPIFRPSCGGENVAVNYRKKGRSREVCLSPMTCGKNPRSRNVSGLVDGFGERKESARQPRVKRSNSNRKERVSSAFEALLIRPNTSGIAMFGDQQRHQSVAAIELVMDRSAACTAGGCDAV